MILLLINIMTITNAIRIWILIIILVGAYILRQHNYAQIPFPGESMDEYSFGWAGLSLIRLGYPIASSGIAGYKTYDYRYINVDQIYRTTAKGNAFSINYPWFDHPPLLGLVTGGYAYLKGAQVFEDTQISLIRKPMIFIGILSVSLLFLYLKSIFGYLEAFIGSIIYAASPLAVIGSRMVQAENLLIPLFLGSLILLHQYIQRKNQLLLWLAAGVAGFALLVKFSAISIILSGILLLMFSSKDRKTALVDCLTFALISLSFILIFLSYGAVYDIQQFITIFVSNGSRFYGAGANALADLITTTKITRFLTDGWFLSGWIAVFMLLFKSASDRSVNFITIPVFSYLVVFLLFGSESYGWYRFPFQPFLFAAIAYVVASAVRNYQNYLPAFLLLLLPVGVTISRLITINEFQDYASIWRWVIGVLLVVYISLTFVKINSKIKRLLPVLLFGLFAAGLVLSIEYFYKITVDYWRGTA